MCFGSVFQPRAARLHGQFQKGGTVRMVEGYRILFHRYPFLKNRQRKTITGFCVSPFPLHCPSGQWSCLCPFGHWICCDHPDTGPTNAVCKMTFRQGMGETVLVCAGREGFMRRKIFTLRKIFCAKKARRPLQNRPRYAMINGLGYDAEAVLRLILQIN